MVTALLTEKEAEAVDAALEQEVREKGGGKEVLSDMQWTGSPTLAEAKPHQGELEARIRA